MKLLTLTLILILLLAQPARADTYPTPHAWRVLGQGCVEYAADQVDVPAYLLATIIEIESAGSPTAVNRWSGASGRGQMMPKYIQAAGFSYASYMASPCLQDILAAEHLDGKRDLLIYMGCRVTPIKMTLAYHGSLRWDTCMLNESNPEGELYWQRYWSLAPAYQAYLGG